MRVLKEQRPMLMGDEERHNLLEGLADIRYVRDLLTLIRQEERARFDERDWGYGDPTYMDGDQMEVFDSQLRTVLYTLFGSDRFADAERKGLQTSLHHASVAMGEDELTDHLSRRGGGPVEAEYIDRLSPKTIAEQLRTGDHPTPAANYPRANAPENGPGSGVAHVGLAKLNATGYRVCSRPVNEVEDITAVEISGSPTAIADLEDLLRRAAGEGDAPLIYRWKAGTTNERMLGANDAILMLCGEEQFGLRPFFHDVLFARLLAAYRELSSRQGERR